MGRSPLHLLLSLRGPRPEQSAVDSASPVHPVGNMPGEEEKNPFPVASVAEDRSLRKDKKPLLQLQAPAPPAGAEEESQARSTQHTYQQHTITQ